ncbi:hypothetical protein [Bradyrhizobium sp. S3.9.1]|uniref:hypothetical protein n=1 Tax=Bradyrhizobium sp. S3.9.1 TaxID=3156431 RepID=UPI00339329D7
MANEDVLRLRATVVSEEALANIRLIGREIGLLPQKARPGLTQINTQFATLSTTVRKLGGELAQLTPGLSGFGLGAAGAGLAAAALVRTLTSISGKIVELRYASKELGMSERELRAWGLAAEKAGISSETILGGLKSFKQTTEEFKYNIGGVRDELIALGAGPVVQRMTAATTQLSKLKEAFDFKEVLMRADPSGYKARKFTEMIGLGADAARLKWEEFSDAMAKTKPLSKEDEERAKQFHDAMIELGNSWNQLVQRTAIKLFPTLGQDIKDIQGIITLFEKLDGILDKWLPGSFGGNLMGRMTAPFVPGAGPSQSILPRAPNQSPRSGYKPTSFGDGFDGGGLSEGSRMVKDGVFAALVDFQSYAQGGGGGGGGGGAASFGGGGYRNLTPGTGGGTAGGASAPGGGADRYTGESIVTGAQTPKGGGRSGYNYFQHRGDAPIRDPSQLATVQTAYGPAKVHPEAADDFKKTADALAEAGAPVGKFGSYNYRQKRWGGGWSSHAYGAALDIGDRASMSPEMKRWITANPDKWKAALAAGNYGQPLTDASMTGGKDAPHIEWRGPRGEKSPQDAAASAGPTGGGGSAADRKTVKGSWFGSGAGWHDPSEPVGRKTASGRSNQLPGIALPDRSGLGKMFEVTTPDGRTFMLPQTDIGPHPRTGRGIDITSSAATQMGYTSKNFPTDKGFSYRRVDEQIAAPTSKVEGNVNLTVNSNGTAAKTSASTDGFWQRSTIQNYKQMQPTEKPSWGAS